MSLVLLFLGFEGVNVYRLSLKNPVCSSSSQVAEHFHIYLSQVASEGPHLFYFTNIVFHVRIQRCSSSLCQLVSPFLTTCWLYQAHYFFL